MASSAFCARFLAERLPYKRAHMETMTSCKSRTMSSFTSPACMTTIFRPCAASADSTYSKPKRIRRSRCSTNMVCTCALPNRRIMPLRRPLRPEPISLTEATTGIFCAMANSNNRASWRSKSVFWSALETRAYSATPPLITLDSWTITVPLGSCSTETGMVPAFHQRHAVLYEMPCSLAQTLSFMPDPDERHIDARIQWRIQGRLWRLLNRLFDGFHIAQDAAQLDHAAQQALFGRCHAPGFQAQV